MSAPATTAALILGSVALAGCSLSDLTFDLAGAGGAAASTTASSGGGSSVVTSSVSTGPAPVVCGNGAKEPGEECDDGNLVALDGCSPACTTDVLETCPGALAPLTPAGLQIEGTLEGATQDVKPSCGTDKADVIYAVVPSVSGTLEASISNLGFQPTALSIRSSCADGPTSELVCSQAVSSGVRIWAHAGVTYWVVVSAQSAQLAPFTLDLKLSPCGDGVVSGLEQCDAPGNPACLGCLSCTGSSEDLDPVSKHCYLFQAGNEKSWAGARNNCIAWGGDLVAPSSAAELAFIAKKLGKAVWSGGSAPAQSCSYSFSNGEPWRARWASGQPNTLPSTGCVIMTSSSGEMSSYPCSLDLGFVCERSPAGSCGDGIVQPGEECDDGAAASKYFDCSGCKLACKAGEFEDPTTRHCYRVVPDLATQSDAASACAGLGAHLAAINTPEENALIQAQITAPTWIGLSSASEAWSNGDPICYSNTANGGPIPKGCAAMLLDGTWAAPSCSAARGYVCERES